MDKRQLCEALKRIAEQTWDSQQKPFLLSGIPSELKCQSLGDDYKSVTGTQSLKSFIKDTGEEFGYQLVEHQTQRAKVGLLPNGVQFSFPAEPKDENAETKGDGATKRGVDGITLMRLLSKLPDSDLEKISIPVSVLAKLFR